LKSVNRGVASGRALPASSAAAVPGVFLPEPDALSSLLSAHSSVTLPAERNLPGKCSCSRLEQDWPKPSAVTTWQIATCADANESGQELAGE
jgi:hypothetical protein